MPVPEKATVPVSVPVPNVHHDERVCVQKRIPIVLLPDGSNKYEPIADCSPKLKRAVMMYAAVSKESDEGIFHLCLKLRDSGLSDEEMIDAVETGIEESGNGSKGYVPLDSF